MDLVYTTEVLGNLGEFVGSLAVMVTLVFLTVQLRQNTRALRSNSWQATQDAETRFDMLLSGDVEFASTWLRGTEHGLGSFDDPAERFRFLITGKQLVDLFHTHHYQHERGMIDDEMWGTWLTQFDEEFERSAGFRDVLRARRPHLRPSFQAFVDARFARVG